MAEPPPRCGRTTAALSQVAHRFGYASEAAFSRAFGVPPGTVRKAVHNEATGTGPVTDTATR